MYAITLSWEQSNNALAWAMETRARLRLTVRLAREWQEVSSEFLGGELLKFLAVTRFSDSWTDRILAGQLLPCSFRKGHRKYMFVSAVTGQKVIDTEHGPQDSYILAWPDGLQEMQRRHYVRAAVPNQYDLWVKAWPAVAAIGDRPVGPPITVGKLIDISTGGAQVELPITDGLKVDDTYLVEIQLPKPEKPALVLARSRRTASGPNEGRFRCGLQFLSLDQSPRGRDTMFRLARFANYLRRFEPVKQSSDVR